MELASGRLREPPLAPCLSRRSVPAQGFRAGTSPRRRRVARFSEKARGKRLIVRQGVPFRPDRARREPPLRTPSGVRDPRDGGPRLGPDAFRDAPSPSGRRRRSPDREPLHWRSHSKGGHPRRRRTESRTGRDDRPGRFGSGGLPAGVGAILNALVPSRASGRRAAVLGRSSGSRPRARVDRGGDGRIRLARDHLGVPASFRRTKARAA